jgi:hypothetical protein
VSFFTRACSADVDVDYWMDGELHSAQGLSAGLRWYVWLYTYEPVWFYSYGVKNCHIILCHAYLRLGTQILRHSLSHLSKSCHTFIGH